jgi:ABC-type glycerol-3-phosphate transport system permease component
MVARNTVRAESNENAEPSESEGPKRTVLSKISMSSNIVLAIYVFVLIGALLVASVHFINFTASDPPYITIEGHRPILVPVNETRVSKFVIYYMDNTIHRFDNDTYALAVTPLLKSQTDWNSITFYVGLDSEESMFAWTTTTYPDGQKDTYQIIGSVGSGVIMANNYNATPGNYSVEIRNVASIDLNGTFHINLAEQFFEKPYFYYGWTGLYISIAGLIIAIVYSALHVFEFSRSWFRRTRF